MLAADWSRLFKGVGKDFGPPPPYEGLYRNGGETCPDVLQELNRVYQRNGLTISQDHANRPDFIGFELDFVRHLAIREAEAWEKNDFEAARKQSSITEEFMDQHLKSWVEKYCEKAREKAETGFYRGVINLVDAVVEGCSLS